MSMYEKQIRYEHRLVHFLAGDCKLDGTKTINNNQISDLVNYEKLPFLFDRIIPCLEYKNANNVNSADFGIKLFKGKTIINFGITASHNNCTYGIEFNSEPKMQVFIKRLKFLQDMMNKLKSKLSVSYKEYVGKKAELIVYFSYDDSIIKEVNPNQHRIDTLTEIKNNLIKSIELIDQELKDLH